jgi:hypothetical protein
VGTAAKVINEKLNRGPEISYQSVHPQVMAGSSHPSDGCVRK